MKVIESEKLLKYWDFSNNVGLNLQNLSVGSHKKVFWKCSKGHSFCSEIRQQYRRGECPVCSGELLVGGINDLLSLYPELCKEWDYEKNEVGPEHFRPGSHEKVFWKCIKCNNKWEAYIYNRTNNSGCPLCGKIKRKESIKKVRGTPKTGQSVAETLPELCKEWDYNKNEVGPEFFLPGSHARVYWICSKCNKKWSTQLYERALAKQGCPECAKEKRNIALSTPKEGYSLLDAFPNLCEEWDYEKNQLGPHRYKPNSHKKVKWVCKRCNNSWEATIKNRVLNNTGCPKCMDGIGTSYPEQAFYYYIRQIYNDAENRYTEFGFEIDIYIPSLRFGIEYDGRNWHSSDRSQKRGKWKDKKCQELGIRLFHVTESTDFSYNKNSLSYPYDYNYKKLDEVILRVLDILGVPNVISVDHNRDRNKILELFTQKEVNDSLSQFPELVAEFDYEKNKPLLPCNFRKGSSKAVFWKCSKCGNGWKASVYDRVSGCGCQKCSRIEVAKKNATPKMGQSLYDLFPDLCKDWDYDKNSIHPSEVNPGSARKVFWKCVNCGHSWRSEVRSRSYRNSGKCPKCKRKWISLT